jgi:hypothetical protein
MRQVLSAVLVSATLALASSPSLAQDDLDLAPLLDGFVEGCVFSGPLYDLISSLPPATREGADLALPEAYAAAAGEPTHETDADVNQIYHLPLTGQWHGQPVLGLDFVNQDDAGMYVAAVRFAGKSKAVDTTFEPLVTQSQAILDQDEMAVDFGHVVTLTTDQGVTRLLCNLST